MSQDTERRVFLKYVFSENLTPIQRTNRTDNNTVTEWATVIICKERKLILKTQWKNSRILCHHGYLCMHSNLNSDHFTSEN